MSPKSKSINNGRKDAKAVHRERVRLNQQRSRARRKAYTEELEERIAILGNAGNQSASANVLKRLTKENNLLRKLLATLGLDEDFVVKYLNAQDQAASLFGALSPPNGQEFALEEDFAITENDALLNEPFEAQEDISTLCIANPDKKSQTICGKQSPRSMNSDAETATAIGENSTSCSIALEFVLANNRKMYQLSQLDEMLECGYLYQNSTEGCRVLNRVLFKVLADIS